MRDREELDEDLPKAIVDSNAKENPLTVAVIDIDDFKDVNERLGHPVGDKVLRVVADTVHGAVEGKGEVYRVGGGDEIFVLLPNSSRPEAEAVLERVRLSVAALNILGLGREITLSVGAAMFPAAGRDKDSLLKAADHAQRAATGC